jgi:GNAT superfamily N-acetyltransferase
LEAGIAALPEMELDMDIELVDSPCEDDISFVRQGLSAYNRGHLESLDRRRFAAFAAAKTVDRGGGSGGRLLRFALDHARENGCAHAFTHTFSFQALPFYKRFGFTVAFEQKGYPLTSSRYFLTLDL